jgi:hypothetical protein
MSNIPKTTAIIAARRAVVIHRCGDRWLVSKFEPACMGRRAWMDGVPSDWWTARRNYAQQCLDHAREAMGLDAVQYDGGEWTNYLSEK